MRAVACVGPRTVGLSVSIGRAAETALTHMWPPATPGKIFCTGAPALYALYASVVTVTTVGYGDYTPTSEAGRAFVTGYALFGCTIRRPMQWALSRGHKGTAKIIDSAAAARSAKRAAATSKTPDNAA